MARGDSLPWLWSVLLHSTMLLAIYLTAQLSFHRASPAATGPAVNAVAVDSRVLKNLQARKQAQAEAQQRKAEAEARARAEAEELARATAQQKIQAEAQAKAEAKAEAQAAAAQLKAEQSKAAQLKASQLKAAQIKAAQAAAKQAQQQQAELQQAEAAHAARAQDQKLRTQRESELRRQLAEEEKIAALQAGPLQKSYIASIQARITRAWIKPESARPGIVCSIEVTQIAGGEVTKARVTNCNGDEAVRQSIENAVYRASPLPEPPDPALFQRNLTLVFKPNE
jgi:colicin import membrane protein